MEKELSKCMNDLLDSVDNIKNRALDLETKSQQIINKLRKTKVDLMEEVYNPAFHIDGDTKGD
jgi:hypothetical protein